MTEHPVVAAVARAAEYRFSKQTADEIMLIAGTGVEGDVHAGATVRHRGRVRADPHQPNLRQVHLIHAELHDELHAGGHPVGPGELGENITTRGLDLLALPTGALLRIGRSAVVRVTGLRNPCRQIDAFQPGLLKQVLGRNADGDIVRRAGVMGIVVQGGPVCPGDPIRVDRPAPPHLPLAPV